MNRGRLRQALRRLRRACRRRPIVLRFDLGERALRSAPHKWTAKRRLMVCTVVASGSFALVSYVWRVLDASGRATEAAAVETLEQRLRESRAKLANLPRLRETARTQPAPGRAATRSAGGDWHAVAELAARTGMTLHALLPASAVTQARGRNGKAARNVLRVDGRADFAGLYAFLGGLSTLPMLVVPEAVEIKPEGGALALTATLDIFDSSAGRAASAAERRAEASDFTDGAVAALAASASVETVESVASVASVASGASGASGGSGGSGTSGTSGTPVRSIASVAAVASVAAGAAGAHASPPLANPFEGGATGAGGSAGRLIGVMQDGRGALALFEPASGLQVVAAVRGQALGRERLVAIDAAGITLDNAGATRRIVFPEGER